MQKFSNVRNIKSLIVLMMLSLIACWGIGQALHRENSQELAEVVVTDLLNTAVFEGSIETSDNPWNTTAGIIEMEDTGEAILLTPNTSVLFPHVDGLTDISFSYMIHPWVKEESDGAGIILSLIDSGNGILHQEVIEISGVDSWTEFKLDISGYKDITAIKLDCNNGKNNDDSCDWVVLSLSETDRSDLGAKQNDQNFPILWSDNVARTGGYEILGGFDGEEPVIKNVNDSWEAGDVLNPSVIRWHDKYYNYYSGYDGNTWRTGLAVSEDGINWIKSTNNPILDIREDGWDATYIAANGSAVVFQDKVYYFYQGVDRETNASAIGLAISSNGENFDERTETCVLSGGGQNQAWESAGVADPYVIEMNGKLYMYYLGQNELGIQRLGVAVSDNGTDWEEYENNPIMDVGVKGAFDECGLGEPSVIYKAPYFYMIYTGRNADEQRNIGVAVSADGVTWKKLNYQGIVDLSGNTWNNQVICDTTMLENSDGDIIVWYGGGNVPSPDENLNGMIGCFTMRLDGIGEASSFNANDEWTSNTVDIRDFLKGCYELESDVGDRYVWTSEEMSVVLKKENGKNIIVVKGYMPLDLHKQAGINEVTLSVYVNDKLVEAQEFASAEVFEILLNISEVVDSEWFELKVLASSYINPKASGLSEDERDLSWMLNEISQK